MYNTGGDITTRASALNWFNIESDTLTMVDIRGTRISGFLVPWVREAPNAGVANEWIDANFYIPNAGKMYTKENGWELVYSNTLQVDPYKYIGLYNKYTGILRFFLYILADPGNQGSSQSVWGISINKETSIMNFNNIYAKGADKPVSSPAYVSTSEGTFVGDKFNSVGIANGTWYAFEVECAYDPNIITDTSYYFTIMGRAINKIASKGKMTTSGGVTGTITTMNASSSSINLSLSNMFNNSNTQSMSVSKNNASTVGEVIDEGIKKNDSFFKGLWNNIKGNASKWIATGLESGAKKGIEAIMSSGGSIAANALKGLFNGLIGGEKQNMISEVDLKLNMESDMQMDSEEMLVGWTDKRLSIPGSPDASLLYNRPLGVWNLRKTPIVYITTKRCLYYATQGRYPYPFAGMKYYYTYSSNVFSSNSVLLNSELEKDFRIENYVATIIAESASNDPFSVPSAVINDGVDENSNESIYVKYYTMGNVNKTSMIKEYYNPNQYLYHKMANFDFKVIISFDLVSKDNKQRFTYNKVFEAEENISIGSSYTAFLDDPYSQHPEFGRF